MNKTVVIYYSFEGNSEFVAENIAKLMGADTEKLRVKNEPPRKGLGKFLHGGKAALFKDDPGLFPLQVDLAAYDTVVMVYPVWAGTFPPAIQEFLKQYPFEGKKLCIVANSASGAAQKSIDQMKEILKKNTICGSLSLQNPKRNEEKALGQIREFVQGIK